MPDQVVEPPGSHEPTEFAKTPKKAAASGWIGSALEYYDFFIYAQAAALVFPIIFFKQDNPKMNIVIALATFGVGYVANAMTMFIFGSCLKKMIGNASGGLRGNEVVFEGTADPATRGSLLRAPCVGSCEPGSSTT